MRAARFLTCKIPSPAIRVRSTFLRCLAARLLVHKEGLTRPEGTDNNLAAVNLVLIWLCRCWRPLPTGNRTAQHLASVRPHSNDPECPRLKVFHFSVAHKIQRELGGLASECGQLLMSSFVLLEFWERQLDYELVDVSRPDKPRD